MKKQGALAALSFIFASTAVLSVYPLTAQAAVNFTNPLVVEGPSGWYEPQGIIKLDPYTGKNTTYVPIWYVMHTLDDTVQTNTWDGTNWRMTQDASHAVNYDWGKPSPGSSPLKIYVNGQLVQTAVPYVTKDPASGKDTTYVPIWYVMQMLKYIGMGSVWTGQGFELSPFQIDSNRKPITITDLGEQVWQQDFGNSPTLSADQEYFPGSNPTEWANIIGLNQELSKNLFVTLDDSAQFGTNNAELQRGYSQVLGNSYRVAYQPEDEYGIYHWEFSSPQNDVPSNLQEAITKTYETMDEITFSQSFDSKHNVTGATATIPTFSASSQWRISAYATQGAKISTNGGTTWSTLPTYPVTYSAPQVDYQSWNVKAFGSAKAPQTVTINATSGIVVFLDEYLNGQTYRLGEVYLGGKDQLVERAKTYFELVNEKYPGTDIPS